MLNVDEQHMQLQAQLIEFEGLKLKPYVCPAGKVTIGIGRNLEARGISREEALYLNDNDIAYYKAQCLKRIPFFSKLSPPRQNVLIDMMFNLGVSGLLSFKKMLRHLEASRFHEAAQEMVNSQWYEQVGRRSAYLTKMLLEDIYFLSAYGK